MIVADASLIAFFSIASEQSALAEAIYARDPIWAAPLVWRSEYLNTLALLGQHRRLGPDTALLALRSAEEVVGDREYRVSSEKVLELAAQSKCGAYDCEYVALARDLNVPLVTADKPVLRAFPKIAVSLEKFAKLK